MTLFKVLGEDGHPFHGGRGVWPLPTNSKPGKWLKVEGELVPCQHGLHLCRPQDLLVWAGPVVWLAEAGRERIVHDDSKVVVRRARLLSRVEGWNDRNLRLFAADCAERVLPLFKRERPDDDRPRKAIEAARAFANGKIDAAAGAAAGTAARAAEGAAEGTAARAAARAAGAAAWAAAGTAARAAGAAAGAAAREWQTGLLLDYLGVAGD